MDEHPGSQRIPLSLNKYLYGNADPVNTIDPSGNFGLAGIGAGLNIQGIMNVAGLAVHALNIYARVSNAIDLITSLVQLIQMDLSIFIDAAGKVTGYGGSVSPRSFPPKIDFFEAAEQFMIGSRIAVSMGFPNWSTGYAKEYAKGKRLKSYVLYIPVLSPAKSKLIDTKRKIFKTPLKIGIGASGGNRGSLAGVGLEMGHERMLYRMDINKTPKGHKLKGNELGTFDMDRNYSFHVYKFDGGGR